MIFDKFFSSGEVLFKIDDERVAFITFYSKIQWINV